MGREDISLEAVKKYLQKQASWVLFRNRRRSWTTNSTLISGPEQLLAADVWTLPRYAEANEDIRDILVCTDGFSKVIFCKMLKNGQSQNSIMAAFSSIFRLNKAKLIFTDQGSVFTGRKAQAFFKDNKKIHFTSNSKSHSFLAEKVFFILFFFFLKKYPIFPPLF
jgi:hypothetical protein